MKNTVVIATPDTQQRNRMAQLVEQLPDFRIVARTADLMNTYNEVEERLPKAVLISDVLASLPEFEVMRALFSTLDVRWLVITSPHRAARPQWSAPGGAEPGSELFSVNSDASADTLAQQIYALTRTDRHAAPAVKPMTARPPVAVQGARVARPEPALRRPTLIPRPVATVKQASAPVPPVVVNSPADPNGRVILIGASTGGVDALLSILTRFPADCPPTLVVQHTGSGFGESLAGLLDRQCRPQVRLARGPETVSRGQILIGAGIRAHLVLQKGSTMRASLVEEGPVSGHVPSVDMLFRSAVPVAARVSAALLTGMGRDGAEGMKALRDAGALTIAQDQATCVVYGMPRAAVDCGAAGRVLPLDRIGEALLAERAADRSHGREMQK